MTSEMEKTIKGNVYPIFCKKGSIEKGDCQEVNDENNVGGGEEHIFVDKQGKIMLRLKQ